jgi:2-dehydro-3-deoxy-L-rhamnonate dehydrogenase (NAD+)
LTIERQERDVSGYRLSGKRAIVTGAARGIGLATATRLLREGAAVALWDRDAARLEKAAGELNALGTVSCHSVDQTELSAVEHAAAATIARFGGIDILVNNAGISGTTGSLWEFDPKLFRAIIEINLIGVFHCCRAIVPAMRSNGWGRIVNVASVAGKEGNPNAAAYSASKAGVIALTKSLGKELAKDGILVNCVTPAAVNTELLEQMPPQHIEYMLSRIPMGRLGTVEENAALITFLCSEEVSFSTAATFDISGGRTTF